MLNKFSALSYTMQFKKLQSQTFFKDKRYYSNFANQPGDIFYKLDKYKFGELHFKHDKASGMSAIIGLCGKRLDDKKIAALGGCRFVSYPDTDAAITDVIRLARGMALKSAISKLAYNGGKAVIIKPNGPIDRKAIFKTFGEFIQQLNGRYITALDSGTNVTDMDYIYSATPYVASHSGIGDPSPYTARGVVNAIETAVQYKFQKTSLSNLYITIQGVGHVGFHIAKLLHDKGAKLTICDKDKANLEECCQKLDVEIADPESIYKIKSDIFVPCALGGVLNSSTLPLLEDKIIVGAANNQLANAEIADQLKQLNILYAPDYLVNAGGLIYCAGKYEGRADHYILSKIDDIAGTLTTVFKEHQKNNLSTDKIAESIALARLEESIVNQNTFNRLRP